MTFFFSKRIFFLIALVGLFYTINLEAFFQQDEWIAFGNALSLGNFSIINLLKFSFAPNVGHYVPFHHLTFGLLFQLIGVDFQKWMLLSILWHLGTTVLVGRLLDRILHDRKLAIVGMVLFGLSASAHQATTWAVADINTHGSTFFGLLSLYFLDNTRFAKPQYKKWVLLSLTSLIISLMFKETTIAMFAVLPIYTLMFLKPGKNFTSVTRDISLWIAAGVIYIGARFWMLLLPSAQGSASVVTASQSIQFILYNLVTSPAKAFFQGLIPQQVVGLVGDAIGYVPGKIVGYSPGMSEFARMIQIPVLEVMFIVLFIFVLIGVYLFKKLISNRSYLLVVFSLIFVSLNSLIYAFSPERTGIVTTIDSRNLYFTLFGCILFILSLYDGISYGKRQKALAILITGVVGLNIHFLFTDFTALRTTGYVRHAVLQQIGSRISDIPSTLVIYVESDTSYYGLPSEKPTPPFQSGFGQTILVYLSKRAQFPSQFYKDYFLWPLGSQGYITSENRGYGYFSNYEQLLSAIKLHNIPVEYVYGFEWRSVTESMLNTTDDIRAKLKKDL